MFEWLFRRPAGQTPAQPAVPALHYTDAEYVRLRHLEGAHGFSCNASGQVWPRQSAGLTQEEDRRQVRGQSALLDGIVALLLQREPPGGAFYVTPRGAYFAKDNACIAVLSRVDGRSR